MLPTPAAHGTPLLAQTPAGQVGEPVPATPAGLTQVAQQAAGWPLGAGQLFDEQLLMTQLTEQQQQRQRWQPQQEGWPGPAAHAPKMDADAWAWLQVSWRVGAGY
jgi:hypothetical protein